MRLIRDNGEVVALSHDLIWVDEFAWSDLAQTSPERTLSGGFVVQQGLKRNGRPISLEPADDSMAWTSRAVVEKLQQWAMLPEAVFSLELPQGAFQVMFDNSQVAVSAKPKVAWLSQSADDDFLLSLKFLTI